MPGAILHPLNFYTGWGMILAAFVCGSAVGLFFHREDFMGGYASLRRRLVRLGHVALAALGVINVLFAISVPTNSSNLVTAASICFIVGGLTMPLVCFLAAWRTPWRHLFFIPVTALIGAVVLVLFGAAS